MAIEGKTEERIAKIRLGMVGGGSGAFIGGVHRMAARLDDRFELVAGALSSTAEKSLASGRELGLDPQRCYGSFEEMAEREAARPDGIEAVSIVTPNHVHYPAAKAFLERGIHVICDKPLTSNLEDAKKLKAVADASRALFVLTHNYTGYPMVRHARELVLSGALGEIRLVQMEYPQDWLAEPIEQTGQKQAAWRTDPKQSGVGGSTGDIGTHAYNLGCFISGLEIEELAADVHTFVDGRQLDDNAHVMLRFKGGAKGLLWCSQVAVGHENGLKVRVYGTKAGLEWVQADPNYLWFTRLGEPKQLITRGGAGAGAAAQRVTRIPSGHPEGYLEAFATIYVEAAAAINAVKSGQPVDPAVTYPTIDDGVKGVAFVEACVTSSKKNGAWVKV
ncbi:MULTISPECIES: Gfo/Idh/MocA family protein [Alphaproteobacteria]|uniref:Oxidoreductase n=2 Tax=Alphaproteobacteria TaxID=28211 RepID=A0A512HJ29_9HYPH|nr:MULTISPECIES: Gfo/Idh/MocA family oxidoreductase [Alphaproteobacteria]GEO85442.1 oxidoreductase [Ciceribacter naphthalenivorans]GLR21536.1 oxidoreductase [Ciceribacter naphthalenivorans]GLT04392.1 oxidoreductase [Sphingomonas psychrolutea]